MKKYTCSMTRKDNPENWYVVDANGAVLGRLASQVAARLRGKMSPLYTPHEDLGDWVVVINADKIQLTGKKWTQKMYYRHSGYPGGLKTVSAAKLNQSRPEDIIRFAVRGMLPKNSLGRKMFGKLRVYRGGEHPHAAQEPEMMTI